MAKYSLGAADHGKTSKTDFSGLLAIIKGRSIISAADWGSDRFEMGLSGNLMIRFFRTQDGMTVNLVSTQNDKENPSLIIDLGDMDNRVPISFIETKLKALRTLYAIFYLLETGKEDILQSYILQHPFGDIERALLENDEHLFIESMSYGSWVLAVWAKAKESYKAVNSVAGLVFQRGREAFLGKLEASTRLRNADANLKEEEVREKQFDITKKQFDFLMDATNKLNVPEAKENLRRRLIEATKSFTIGDKSDSHSYLQLGQETIAKLPVSLDTKTLPNKQIGGKKPDNDKNG